MDGMAGKPTEKKQLVVDIPLSEREMEVLHLICKEKTNVEIADTIFVSTRTLEAHKRNLLSKNCCKNVAGLVLYAIERNLFDGL